MDMKVGAKKSGQCLFLTECPDHACRPADYQLIETRPTAPHYLPALQLLEAC
jgi:hypothetical protein